MNAGEHENKARIQTTVGTVMIPWHRDRMMGWRQQVDVCPLCGHVAG